MRATLTSTLTFQVWLNHNPQRTRYAYQVFGPDEPWLRWDNAPHYPDLKTNFPHHFHHEQETSPSTLQGDPLQDLPFVLGEIKDYLKDYSSID